MVRSWPTCLFLLFQLHVIQAQSQTYIPPFVEPPLAGPTDPSAYWVTEVTIGKQKLNLLVDTAATELWAFGTGLSYLGGVDPVRHNEYTCEVGLTSNCTSEGSFSVQYGSAASTVSGSITYDQVNVSHAIVTEMAVGMANEVGSPAQWPPDGILGLGLAKNNGATTPLQTTFLERLISQLPDPIFGLDFLKTSAGDCLVELEFGYVNQTKAKAGLRTVPSSTTSWMLSDVSFTIGGVKDGVPVPVNPGSEIPVTQNLMFDTAGGSQFGVDPRVTQAYYDEVDGAVPIDPKNTSFKFPCNTKLPDVYLNFQNNQSFAFQGQALTFNNPDEDDMCTGPLSSIGTDPVSSIGFTMGIGGGVGALFFESNYVVFNMSSEPSISFAPWNATAEHLFRTGRQATDLSNSADLVENNQWQAERISAFIPPS